MKNDIRPENILLIRPRHHQFIIQILKIFLLVKLKKFMETDQQNLMLPAKEKNMGILTVVSRAAPIFGFVGTLVGLMQLFSQIYQSGGDINLGVISQGIYTKLITSITGLVIGLIAFLCYNYLHAQVNRTVNKMEASAADFLDVLQEPSR